MLLAKAQIAVSVLILLSVTAKGYSVAERVQHNATASFSLRRMMHQNRRPPGCRKTPWICNQGQFPPPRPRRLCCRNRCVDVSSDVNNCGFCGIRCPFTWQCCRGLCSNINLSRFNCGRCGNRCPYGIQCFYGMCGYAQPLPPWPRPPFPYPPRPPKPKPPNRPPPRGDEPPAYAMD